MPVHITVIAMMAAVVLGFLGGLLTFKKAQQWCPECGATLRCLDCLKRTRAS